MEMEALGKNLNHWDGAHRFLYFYEPFFLIFWLFLVIINYINKIQLTQCLGTYTEILIDPKFTNTLRWRSYEHVQDGLWNCLRWQFHDTIVLHFPLVSRLAMLKWFDTGALT